MPRPSPSPQQSASWQRVIGWMVEQSGGQQYLAARLRVSRQTVSRWVTGERIPDVLTRHLVRLEYARLVRRVLDAIPDLPADNA